MSIASQHDNALGVAEGISWPRAPARGDYWFALALALAFSTIVFLPQTGFKGAAGGENFQGDTLNFWLPQFGVLEYFVSKGVLSGIDYTTHNGAAEWFLRPNLIAYHPLYLATAFLTDNFKAVDQAVAIVAILWMHAFVSVFCLYRLCRAFLGMDQALAAFVAIGYSFSPYLSQIIGCVPYAYIVWLMPAIMYGAVASAHVLTPFRAVLGSLAIFCTILGGYLPLALFSIGVAGLFLIFYVFVLAGDGGARGDRLRQFARGLAPFVIAAVFCFFFLYALRGYLHGVIEPAYSNNIQYSAYDLAEKPHTLFRLLSGMITIPGPYVEFTLAWGWIVVSILVCFILRSHAVLPTVAPSGRMLLTASWSAYFFFALLIYGGATALTAIFYYFMPVIGFMHIYQRFLPMAQIFLLLGTAVMLAALTRSPARGAEKGLLLLLVTLAGVMSWALASGAKLAPFGFDQGAIVEVIYACLFLLALILFDRRVAIWAATILMFLVPLERVYVYVTSPSLNIKGQSALIAPLDEEAAKVIDKQILSYQGTKQIVKYVDITPGIMGAIPENYPWFRINQAYMSTYTGYDFHVGVRRDYRQRMPTTVPAGMSDWRVLPDPGWVRATGADAILFQPGDPANNPALLAMADLSDPSKVQTVRGVYTLAPLRTASPAGGGPADNGYFRILQAGQARIGAFKTNRAGSFDMTVTAERHGRLEYLFWPNERLVFKVNGKRVVPGKTGAGLLYVPVTPGENKVTVRYRNRAIDLFLIGYVVYAALVTIVLGAAIFGALSGWARRRRQHA